MASALAKEKAFSSRAYCFKNKRIKEAENSSEVYSFDFIKEQIKEKNIKSLDCDCDCGLWIVDWIVLS